MFLSYGLIMMVNVVVIVKVVVMVNVVVTVNVVVVVLTIMNSGEERGRNHVVLLPWLANRWHLEVST